MKEVSWCRGMKTTSDQSVHKAISVKMQGSRSLTISIVREVKTECVRFLPIEPIQFDFHVFISFSNKY